MHQWSHIIAQSNSLAESIRINFQMAKKSSRHLFATTPAASLLAAIVTFGPSISSADTVEKVKGKQAIVVFDSGAAVNPGDKFFATEGGKKKALLEVVKAKGNKAVVKVLKGTPAEGMDVMAAGAGKSHAANSGDASAEDHSSKPVRNAGAATLFKDMTVGAVVGYAMDSQSVSVSGTSTSMSGSGFSLRGFADIPVSGALSLYGRAGAEMFSAQSGSFKTDIMYAVVDLMLKYSLSEGNFRPFVMGGLGLHFPVSKSSNILDVNRISSTTVFYGGGGFNFVMGGSSYFQLTAEYGMFPPSNDVSTTFIAVRGGMGFRF